MGSLMDVITARQFLRRLVRRIHERLQRGLATAGLRQSESKLSIDAQRYWNDPSTGNRQADSHWRESTPFRDSDLWSAIGHRHLLMLERGARTIGVSRPPNRILEWGCGGGANAVHFAPRAQEFIGVEVSAESLTECARQIAEVCDTPFQPVLVDVADPEHALNLIHGSIDVFLCLYVFELLPTPEYGARILRIARELLAPGGLALIQIKYDDGRWTSKPRRRAYRSGVASMTSYPIASFWQLAEDCGLIPESIELVPRNELDERYAYFILSRPGDERTR